MQILFGKFFFFIFKTTVTKSTSQLHFQKVQGCPQKSFQELHIFSLLSKYFFLYRISIVLFGLQLYIQTDLKNSKFELFYSKLYFKYFFINYKFIFIIMLCSTVMIFHLLLCLPLGLWAHKDYKNSAQQAHPGEQEV